MTREKAKRIMNKINNLERFLSNFERNNKEVSDGLSSLKKNLHRYLCGGSK
jgi:molecular chaperone GrpE (heat shock protein)